MISFETRLGNVIISEAYLSKLIGHEVTSCFGVVGMIPKGNRQKISHFVSKGKSVDTGIKVTGNAETAKVEVHIAVSYGMNINAIAVSITEKVKYIVKEACGINVEKVIVKIDGIKE